MSYRSKKEVLSSILNRTRIIGGKRVEVFDAFLGYDPITGKQRKISSNNPATLKKKINKFFLTLSTGGNSAVELTEAQIQDAIESFNLIAGAGLDIPISEAVRGFLAGPAVRKGECTTTVGSAYSAYFASFNANQKLHKKAIKARVGVWVEYFGKDRLLSEITVNEFRDWLEKNHGNSNKTYNNYLQYVGSFLNWCAKKGRGWIPENPLADVEKKPIAYKEPEYMKPEDAKKLFEYLYEKRDRRPDILAYAVLSFFCGVRREEILRMASDERASKISLEDETIRISMPKGWTKGIAPRAFPIQPNALKWMESFPFVESVGKIGPRSICVIGDWAKKIGVKMPKNAGRHSFITFHVAAYQKPQETAAAAGTSFPMLVRNYRGLASQKDGIAYFEIEPPNE